MYELGVVHVLAEPGQGVEAVQQYDRQDRPAASRRSSPITARPSAPTRSPSTSSMTSSSLWADACLTLDAHDLAVMRRLVAAQSKLPVVEKAAA